MGSSTASFEINPEQLRRFAGVLEQYRDALRDNSESALRRGTIDLLKSLRARTVRAPKRREVKPVKSGGKAVRVVGRHAPFKGQTVKLFRVRVRNHWRFTVGDKISAVRRSRQAQIVRRGLAKKSWSWLMHLLFKTGNPSRDCPAPVPEGAVRGSYRTKDGWAGVEIMNALDYIGAALPSGAVSESFAAAERSILYKVERAHEKAARKARLV